MKRRIIFLVSAIFVFQMALAGFVVWYSSHMSIPYKDYMVPLLTSFVTPVASVVALVVLPVIVREEDKQEALLKEQRQYALELFRALMGSEFYVNARLVTQEYLLPPGNKYTEFRGLDFDEINAALINRLDFTSKPKSDQDFARDLEARTCIRSVTNFFWLVDQAKERGLIAKDERIFAESYAWYWIHIISLHIKEDTKSKSSRFQPFVWMTDKSHVQRFYDERLARYDGEATGEEKMKYKGIAPW